MELFNEVISYVENNGLAMKKPFSFQILECDQGFNISFHTTGKLNTGLHPKGFVLISKKRKIEIKPIFDNSEPRPNQDKDKKLPSTSHYRNQEIEISIDWTRDGFYVSPNLRDREHTKTFHTTFESAIKEAKERIDRWDEDDIWY